MLNFSGEKRIIIQLKIQVQRYGIITPTILFLMHVLTPFFSPSLLRKEGECSAIQRIKPPRCKAERGFGGEFMKHA
jgi:hypothetical protein